MFGSPSLQVHSATPQSHKTHMLNYRETVKPSRGPGERQVVHTIHIVWKASELHGMDLLVSSGSWSDPRSSDSIVLGTSALLVALIDEATICDCCGMPPSFWRPCELGCMLVARPAPASACPSLHSRTNCTVSADTSHTVNYVLLEGPCSSSKLCSTGRWTHPAAKVARQVEGMVGRRAAMCCARIVPCGDTTSLAVGTGAVPPSSGLRIILLAACSSHNKKRADVRPWAVACNYCRSVR